jgi:hypothetical protein
MSDIWPYGEIADAEEEELATWFYSSTMTDDETFIDPDTGTYTYFLDPNGAARNFNPSGSFREGFRAYVKNIDATYNITFDSESSAFVIGPGEFAVAIFDGEVWDTCILHASRHITGGYAMPSDESLVAYWSFDDGAGTTAVDNSGNGNDGTLTNMEEADWVDGISGKALDFDGVDDHVVTTLTPPKPISISAWVNADDFGEDGYIARSSKAIYFRVTTDGKVRFFMYDGSLNDLLSTTVLSTGQWYHVVVSWDGTTGDDSQKIYIDGELDNANAAHGTDYDNDGNSFTFGARDTYHSHFDGTIDEVRIYNTVLTANEVKALYLYPAGNKSSVISSAQIRWE